MGISVSTLVVTLAALGQMPADNAFPASGDRQCVLRWFEQPGDVSDHYARGARAHQQRVRRHRTADPRVGRVAGIKLRDVKVLLASHAHSDHVEGHTQLQELTGAKVYVMQGDDHVIAAGGEGQYLYTDSRWKPSPSTACSKTVTRCGLET